MTDRTSSCSEVVNIWKKIYKYFWYNTVRIFLTSKATGALSKIKQK